MNPGKKGMSVPFLDLQAQYQMIGTRVREAIESVLASGQFVAGEAVEHFEGEFARYLGVDHAVAMSSGTSALELSLRAAGVGPGCEVIVPANSFIATAEAVSNVGAEPVFVDVDRVTFHLDLESAQRKLSTRTRAVIPVHLYGRAVDLEAVERFALATGLIIVEDAAQAQGTRHRGARVGSAGRLTCFSFYPGKNLGACGDAGAVTTNDSVLAANLRLLRNHGSASKYNHVLVGTNARMASIQAAVLSVKLGYLDPWNQRRQEHARAYVRGLAGSGVALPDLPSNGEHVFHLFVIRSKHRDALREFLAIRGVETGIHYPVPLHLTPAYRSISKAVESLPVCEELSATVLSLPMYPEMTVEQRSFVIACVHEFHAMQQRGLHARIAA
jgi:dTDP-4-amino-4,6-dideoxygalactose transaminase